MATSPRPAPSPPRPSPLSPAPPPPPTPRSGSREPRPLRRVSPGQVHLEPSPSLPCVAGAPGAGGAGERRRQEPCWGQGWVLAAELEAPQALHQEAQNHGAP